MTGGIRRTGGGVLNNLETVRSKFLGQTRASRPPQLPVRMGISLLSRLPGLVPQRPRPGYSARAGAKRRSRLAGLIWRTKCRCVQLKRP